jgi:hypothetical protein
MPITSSVVKLQTLAAHIKLSVAVSVRQHGAAVQAAVIEGVTQYVKLRAGVDATTLSAQAQYALMKADAIVGEFLKLIGLDDAVVLNEAQVKVLSKALQDALVSTDASVWQVTKPVADNTLVAEFSVRNIAKPLDEIKTAVDVAVHTFAKKPALEALYVADNAEVVSTKGLRDVVYQIEGPAIGQTYADPSYFAQDYTWDGAPLKAFDKTLSDTLHATDDFFGSANVDDDQTIFMTKTVVDTAATSELLGKTFVRPGVIDSAAVSDAAAVSAGKSLTDSIGFADIVAHEANKALDDAAISIDSQTRLTDKVLSEFPLSAADLKTFSLARVSIDSVSSSDEAMRSVERVASDTFGQTDSSTKETSKSLADASATSDSGSLRKTDYADITYFSEDYVGTTLNF